MANGVTGEMYVEGDEKTDPSKRKALKAAEPPEPPPDEEVGKFRAKDAAEALKMAKGEYHSPAEGPARGAQTP
jgi:hypothetical protein